MTKPPKSILSPDFVYTDSANTNISKRFAKVRKELRARADQEARERAEADARTQRTISIFDARRRAKT